MKINGAIFDLDGTLLDSMHIWEEIGRDYLKLKGIIPDMSIKHELKVMSLYNAACYMKEKYCISDSTDKIMSDINKMTEDFYINDVLPKEGAVDFLKALQEKGVRMCLATATDRYLAEAALKRNGMLDFFGRIFTCTEVGHGKDQPFIFRSALAYLDTDISSVWVFEDASHAAHTAKKEGFNVCAIFDKSESDSKTLEKNSDIYIQSFKEASEYFD